MSNVVLLQWLFDVSLTGTHISRGFKVHNLITWKSKVQAGLEKSTSPTPGASESFCLASE